MGIVFFIVAVLTVFFGLGVVVLGKNPVHTAMFLVGVMICIAVHYLMMANEFLAFAQIIIYAGAIVVLFLFIIMLLNIRESDVSFSAAFTTKVGAVMLALVLGFALHMVSVEPIVLKPQGLQSVELYEPGAATRALAQALLTRYMLPFQLVAILLLVAMVGAVVIGMRDPRFKRPVAETSRG